MANKMTCLDYCQYLLVTQINYTLTNFADHSNKFSHDKINRFLKGEKITPRLIWENVKSQLITSESGYLIFDDTVLDKNFSFKIELVRRQAARMRHRLQSRLAKLSLCAWQCQEGNKRYRSSYLYLRKSSHRPVRGVSPIVCSAD